MTSRQVWRTPDGDVFFVHTTRSVSELSSFAALELGSTIRTGNDFLNDLGAIPARIICPFDFMVSDDSVHFFSGGIMAIACIDRNAI